MSPFYDSMLAKIVAHGADRADALRRLARGLDDCVLLGVKTNRHFLARCLAHPLFAAGGATTAFIGDCLPPAPLSTDARAIEVGAALLAAERSRACAPNYPAELRGWSNSAAYPQWLRFELDGESIRKKQGGR